MKYTKEISGTFLAGHSLRYKLLADLNVYTDLFGERRYFKIPKGFITDFASVPHFLWSFCSPVDEFIRIPAVIHDYLYKVANYNRLQADLIFYEKMRSFGKITIKPFLAFVAVRLFGWIWFNKK